MVGKIDLQKGKIDDAERFALRVNFFIGNNRPFAQFGHMVQNHTWDFQKIKNSRSRWTGMSCFVLKVPLCNLYPCRSCLLKAISKANDKDHRRSTEPLKLKANTCNMKMQVRLLSLALLLNE